MVKTIEEIKSTQDLEDFLKGGGAVLGTVRPEVKHGGGYPEDRTLMELSAHGTTGFKGLKIHNFRLETLILEPVDVLFEDIDQLIKDYKDSVGIKLTKEEHTVLVRNLRPKVDRTPREMALIKLVDGAISLYTDKENGFFSINEVGQEIDGDIEILEVLS